MKHRHRSEMRHVDLLAHAVPLAGEQRGDYAEGQHDRARLIGDSAGDVSRGLVGAADRVHDSRTGLSEVVERRVAAFGAFGAVAGRARIDQARIARAERRVVKPQALRDTLAEVLQEHVALRREPRHDFAGLGLLQVQCKALLVAVVRLEIEVARGLIGRAAGHRQDPSAGVAAFPLLQLDDLGAQIGEHHGGHRTLLPDGPIDDPNSFQRSIHNLTPIMPRAYSRAYIAQDRTGGRRVREDAPAPEPASTGRAGTARGLRQASQVRDARAQPLTVL